MIRGISEDILRRVYDFSDMTNEELRCKFFQKLQECIELCNNTSEIVEWLKNEWLEEKVNELLTVWLEDGTLNEIIDTNLKDILKAELTEEINTIKNEITNINTEINNIKKEIEVLKNVGA